MSLSTFHYELSICNFISEIELHKYKKDNISLISFGQESEP